MSRQRLVGSKRHDAANKRVDMLARNPVFRALCHVPMSVDKQTDLLLAARIAFDSVQRGTSTDSDRDTLVCLVNVGMILTQKHCSESDLEDQLAAQDALLRADGRALLGKRWGFDGPGRVAMLRAIEAHEQLIAQLGQGMVTDALLTMIDMRAAGQVHRVEVVPA